MKSMKQKNPGAAEAGSRILAKLTAEKKKVITAMCLLTVMSLMWIKVFVGKSPQNVEATESLETSSGKEFSYEQTEEGIGPEIHYFELPRVDGRNDVLTRDFFSFDSRDFYEGAGKEIKSVSENNSDEALMRKISAKLTLGAIVLGDNPQAFINDKLFNVGDKLTVTEGSVMYVCEIANIGETEVKIKCREGTITLKILQSLEVLN